MWDSVSNKNTNTKNKLHYKSQINQCIKENNDGIEKLIVERNNQLNIYTPVFAQKALKKRESRNRKIVRLKTTIKYKMNRKKNEKKPIASKNIKPYYKSDGYLNKYQVFGCCTDVHKKNVSTLTCTKIKCELTWHHSCLLNSYKSNARKKLNAAKKKKNWMCPVCDVNFYS